MYDIIFDVSVVGHYTVNRSSLLHRFVNNKDNNKDNNNSKYKSKHNDNVYIPIDCSQKIIEVSPDHKKVKFCVWDISSIYRLYNINNSNTKQSRYQTSHNIILMFDLSNMESFEYIFTLYRDVKKYGPTDIIIFLVGDNCNEHHVVTKQQIYNLCSTLIVPYYEICTKNNTGIDTLFNDLYCESTKRNINYIDDNEYININNSVNINNDNTKNNIIKYNRFDSHIQIISDSYKTCIVM